VIAKRRLLGDFHSPVPATPAAARQTQRGGLD
jgi:hypothetical protein